MPLPDWRDPVECVLLVAIATSLLGIALTAFTNSPLAGSIANLIVLLLVVSGLPCALGANAGKNRSCGARGGALMCGLLSFFGLIILACQPRTGDVECPQCHNRVYLNDRTCGVCHTALRAD